MKQPIALLVLVTALAGCSPHHPISADTNALLKRWNNDLAQPELRLEAIGNSTIFRSPIGVWVAYYPKDKSWMVMAPQPAAAITCAELVVAATGMSIDQTQSLLKRLDESNQWTVSDGNLQVYFNPVGGTMCRVTDLSRG